ncbi:hypothetical protein D3C76_1349720 [compost metagenome]
MIKYAGEGNGVGFGVLSGVLLTALPRSVNVSDPHVRAPVGSSGYRQRADCRPHHAVMCEFEVVFNFYR